MSFAQAWAAAFPPYMWILLVVAAVLCAVGFYKFVYFLSVGYGFAVLGVGAALIVMFINSGMSWACLIQCILFIIYGIRLGGFLLIREIRSKSYRDTLKTATNEGAKPMPFFVKFVIWASVAVLYVMQTSPVYYRLANGRGDGVMPIVGAIIMALALILETAADSQKSAAKKKDPHRFCDTGLYKIVRCPNYLGEILFWTGVLVSGFGGLTGAVQWVIAILGYIIIVYVMFSGAKRLEGRQNKNYGDREDYRAYVNKTPIILPLVPLYTLHTKAWDFVK